MDVYCDHVMKSLKASGASAKEIADKAVEMAEAKERYKNPINVVLYTYVEILPVGLLISLISAAILKRKAK